MPLVSLTTFVRNFVKEFAKSKETIVFFQLIIALVLKNSGRLGEGYHIPWNRLF